MSRSLVKFMCCLCKKNSEEKYSNDSVSKVIDEIERHLTDKELSSFLMDLNGVKVTFRDRMLARYENSYFIYPSIESAKEEISEIIDSHRPLIQDKTSLNVLFLDEFQDTIFFNI